MTRGSSAFRTILITAAAVAAAVGLRMPFHQVLGEFAPYATVYGAVAVAVWLGGWKAGAATATIGIAGFQYYLVSPRGSFAFDNPALFPAWLLAALSCGLIILMGEVLLRVRRVTEQQRQALANARDELELVATRMLKANHTLFAETAALARLHDASTKLWHEPDLSVGLNEILRGAITLLDADFGNVQMVDPDTAKLRVVAQQGFSPEFLQHVDEVAVEGVGASSRAQLSSTRVVIPDVELDAEYVPLRALAAAADYRAVQATPLIARNGKLLGMFSTMWRQPHTPTAEDLRRLDLFARQAVDYIEHWNAQRALELADKRKEEFLATLAHELRNPLAPIRYAVEILKLEQDSLPDRAQDQVGVIDRQSAQLMGLLDRLLDISRISRNIFVLNRGRHELQAVLAAAVEASRPRIEHGGHELVVDLPPDPVTIDVDAVRIHQIVCNLLNNAAKFSEPNGRIELRAMKQGNELMVSVRDRGYGIEQAALPDLFELFAPSTPNRSTGTGIGLTLAKALAEQHGGTLEAYSDGPGTGSEFVLRLPVLVPADVTQVAAVPMPDVIPFVKRRVLVADDETDNSTSLSTILESMGHVVRTANDGEEAVSQIAPFRPDIVLMDIGMPRMDGYTACGKIRATPEGKDLLIVALTGWGQAADVKRARAAGFDAHFVKPIAMTTLESLLKMRRASEGRPVESVSAG